MLQFADDVLLIGDGSVTNTWAFKAVLRAFELTSGLKINFSKSCPYGIGVDPAFLVAAEEFLHCKSGRLSFNFLGLLAPKKIVNDIIAIQRRFLWAGNSNKKFISWISWNSICKPKEHGGLGIKHVGRFNCALIEKWLWRFQSGGNEIWRKTLILRYGNLRMKVQTFTDVGSSKFDSS
ncbi:unnamed protein product [Lathyrus sativus]|nr:unnamed protein product [Lathyrus sativus]